MSGVKENKKDMLYAYVNTICKRIQSLLPDRTGLTIAEVELNPQYQVTKEVLLAKEKNNSVKGDSTFTSNIVQCFCGILDEINHESRGTKPREGDEKSLSSMLIVLKLLSEILKCSWRLKRPFDDFKYDAFSSNCDAPSNYSIYYHYYPPPPLSPAIVRPSIDTLLSLLSPQIVRKILVLLRKSSKEGTDLNNAFKLQYNNQNHHHNYTSPSTGSLRESSLSADNETSSQKSGRKDDYFYNYINEIDSYIEITLRYIAAANPESYYDYVEANLFKYAELGEIVPSHDLQKYSPLIKYLFYQGPIGERVVKDMYHLLPYVKSSSWKLAFIVFYATSIKDQSFSRPEDFSHIAGQSYESEFTCKNLFDYVHTIMEELPNSACTAMILSWLSVLCVSDFIELENKPNKLRIAFNKRLKFLVGILKDASSGASLSCFDSLISIFFLGASLGRTSENHPIFKFSVTYLDETYFSLVKIQSKLKDGSTRKLADNLLINFYICAIIINPTKYIELLVQESIETNGDFQSFRILTKVTKGLSEFEITSRPFIQVMKRLDTFLQLMMFQSTKYLILADTKGKKSQRCDNSISDLSSCSNRKNDSQDAIMLGSKSLEGCNLDISSTSNTKREIDSINTLLTELESYSSNPSTSTILDQSHSVKDIESILSDLFSIFKASSALYFKNSNFLRKLESMEDNETLRDTVDKFAYEITIPLRYAFRSGDTSYSALFDSACALSMSVLDLQSVTKESLTSTSIYLNYAIAMYIMQSVCEACLLLSLVDPKFKECFIYLNEFLKLRDEYSEAAFKSSDLRNLVDFLQFESAFISLEKVLLLSLCTHDIQFYNIAKVSMKWYCKELNSCGSAKKQLPENLSDTFERVIQDDFVFTGFVSLHKKFKHILKDSKPTQSLYEIWCAIYKRWLHLLEHKNHHLEENLIFRHFTGFLVSTSGCFHQEEFNRKDETLKQTMQTLVSGFLDRCIQLLTSDDLVIRVVAKDALCMESHSETFYLICSKMMDVAALYTKNKLFNEESILFMEQSIIIMTTMVGLRNDGAFVLIAMLPDFTKNIFEYIGFVDNLSDALRLKLRYCKLGIAIESTKSSNGISGAFKQRNYLVKIVSEWLEHAVFYDEMSTGDASISSPVSISYSSIGSTKESDIAYLNIDLATECSKYLSLQLVDLILEIPEGTKDSDIKKNKDLSFANYLSLFYRVLQKYTSSDLATSVIKSKYKINLITDNVLKCISSILQYDTDIGMQFVLPLGYHENSKIRSIFLNVFANMLASRKKGQTEEEFSDDLLQELSETYEICSVTTEVASLIEHNLLASSLLLVFGYTRKLDKLFRSLLDNEIERVTRSSEIFRRNSTLTKLLSKFARDYGLDYLDVTIKPYLEDIINEEIIVEVEKNDDNEGDAEIFMKYLSKLVKIIISSVDDATPSFRFICSEIYHCVKSKFEDSAIVAVGSFIFLRFFCPSLLSSKHYFDLSVQNAKVKRTLMQIVKVLQNMANGSLNLLKWPGLATKTKELNDLNRLVFEFLERISTCTTVEYPFEVVEKKPVPELRYLHKFLYTYFASIKSQYVIREPFFGVDELRERVEKFKRFDKLVQKLGQPKALISLQTTTALKNIDAPTNTFNDFMSKMSSCYLETAVDCPVVHNSIFHDGTPVIVMNFGSLKNINYDIQLMVYKFFELATHVWDNKFYLVADFTEAYFDRPMARKYTQLLNSYAPSQLFKNCTKIFYFNIPDKDFAQTVEHLNSMRFQENPHLKIYTYSQADDPEIISSLCLSETTESISRDTRVVFNDVSVYDYRTGKLSPVTLKFGRQWLQVCSEYMPFKNPVQGSSGFLPIEVYNLANIVKCEISKYSGNQDEFTIFWNSGPQTTFKSSDKQEILKFLYFATSRLPKSFLYNESYSEECEQNSYLWFGRLYNLTFQGLLSHDEEVRSSSALLFSSLATYYEFDMEISSKHTGNVAFPPNITDFIVATSKYLSTLQPAMTYRFFKAFFEYFEKLPKENRLSALLYISPWVDNVRDYMSEADGPEKVAEIVRQLCRLSTLNKDQMGCLNDYIWRKLLKDSRLIPIILDEIVAFTIDNRNDKPDWHFIIYFISPSVDVCGEVISRLISCVHKVSTHDSAIALESKLFEIKVLVRICTSLFFNSYNYATMYLADVFFISTLFIDNYSLDVGDDLQKLLVYTIQSFFQKPDLTKGERITIDDTLAYLSGQRAKMLFGMTRDRNSASDASQIYIRTTSFDVLCKYLTTFISKVGSPDEKSAWKSRWSSDSIETAFNRTSIFQVRALLVAGILSKQGISDSTASRILKLECLNYEPSLEYLIYLTMSIARVFEGLSASSSLLLSLVWTQLSFGLLNLAPLYQPFILCFASTLQKIHNKESNSYKKIFEYRFYLEPFITEFENRHNISICEENFEIYTFIIFSQGLKLSSCKHTALDCLKQYFDLNYRGSDDKIDHQFSKVSNSYLVFIYLFAPTSVLEAMLDEYRLNASTVNVFGNVEIPLCIVDFMLSDTKEALITLLHASYFFELETSDSSFKSKFLYLYLHLFRANKDFGMFIYHIIRSEMEEFFIRANSTDMVNVISEIQTYIIMDKEYSDETYRKKVVTFLDDNKLSILQLNKRSKANDFFDASNKLQSRYSKDYKMIQEMMYRCACSHVEAQELED